MLGVWTEFGKNLGKLFNRNIQLQTLKSKNPSANAGVFSVSDGGLWRNRTSDTSVL